MKLFFVEENRFFSAGERIFYTLLLFFASCTTVMIPVATGAFVDAVVGHRSVFWAGGCFTALVFFRLFTEFFSKSYASRIARNAELSCRKALLNILCQMRPGSFDCYRQGDIAMKFFRDVAVIGRWILDFFPLMAGGIFNVILSVFIMMYKNYRLALFFLPFFPIIIWLACVFQKRFRKNQKTLRTLSDLFVNRIFEFVHVFPYLKSLAAETPYLTVPRKTFYRFDREYRHGDTLGIKYELANRSILLFGEILVLFIAGFQALRHEIPVGDVVVYQMLFVSALNCVCDLFKLLPLREEIKEGIVSLGEIMEEYSHQENDLNGIHLKSALGDLCMENVVFSYQGKKIFDRFYCRIPAGSIVAITGKNGTGKTTLVKLLTSYLEADSGKITLAGTELKCFAKRDLRKKISAVYQNNILITGTLRDNVTLKDQDYSVEEVFEALRMADAEEIISRMPEKLDHVIDFDGGNLSGGEQQKIAIARALIRRPDILVFDEVTNHLDRDARNGILRLLNDLRGKTTVLLVSHDPAIIANCDMEINLDVAKGDAEC